MAEKVKAVELADLSKPPFSLKYAKKAELVSQNADTVTVNYPVYAEQDGKNVEINRGRLVLAKTPAGMTADGVTPEKLVEYRNKAYVADKTRALRPENAKFAGYDDAEVIVLKACDKINPGTLDKLLALGPEQAKKMIADARAGLEALGILDEVRQEAAEA